MKHSLRITMMLVLLFFCAQVMGLLITGSYVNLEASEEDVVFDALPYDIERPPVEEEGSYIFMIAAVLVGTCIALLLIKFKKLMIWKVWFFLAVMLCLTIAFGAFMNHLVAIILAVLLAAYKIFRPNFFVHNITEIFIYGGLAAIFVPIMNVFAVSVLLILIAIYDFIAVYKIKHMVTMAKFQAESKVFAGLFIPYDKKSSSIVYNSPKKGGKKTLARTAILGGGDIGFPLMFAGVVMNSVILEDGFLISFLKSMIIVLCATFSLYILLMQGEKEKFYPAMPILALGCFVGYAIMLLV